MTIPASNVAIPETVPPNCKRTKSLHGENSCHAHTHIRFVKLPHNSLLSPLPLASVHFSSVPPKAGSKRSTPSSVQAIRKKFQQGLQSNNKGSRREYTSKVITKEEAYEDKTRYLYFAMKYGPLHADIYQRSELPGRSYAYIVKVRACRLQKWIRKLLAKIHQRRIHNHSVTAIEWIFRRGVAECMHTLHLNTLVPFLSRSSNRYRLQTMMRRWKQYTSLSLRVRISRRALCHRQTESCFIAWLNYLSRRKMTVVLVTLQRRRTLLYNGLAFWKLRYQLHAFARRQISQWWQEVYTRRWWSWCHAIAQHQVARYLLQRWIRGTLARIRVQELRDDAAIRKCLDSCVHVVTCDALSQLRSTKRREILTKEVEWNQRETDDILSAEAIVMEQASRDLKRVVRNNTRRRVDRIVQKLLADSALTQTNRQLKALEEVAIQAVVTDMKRAAREEVVVRLAPFRPSSVGCIVCYVQDIYSDPILSIPHDCRECNATHANVRTALQCIDEHEASFYDNNQKKVGLYLY